MSCSDTANLLNALERSFSSVCCLAYENMPDADPEIQEDFTRQMEDAEECFKKALDALRTI